MKIVRCFMCEKKTSAYHAAGTTLPVDLCIRCFARVYGLLENYISIKAIEQVQRPLIALLKLTEWEGGMDETCPRCKAYTLNGHQEWCEIGAYLHPKEEIKPE